MVNIAIIVVTWWHWLRTVQYCWYWASKGPLCLYKMNKWRFVRVLLTHSKESATQLLRIRSGAFTHKKTENSGFFLNPLYVTTYRALVDWRRLESYTSLQQADK